MIRSSQLNTIQPILYDQADKPIKSIQRLLWSEGPIISCLTASVSILYTKFPDYSPPSNFPPSLEAYDARHLISSSAAAYYYAFFASDLDSTIPKSDFLAFLITSATGKSFEVTCACLMDPHRHRFFFQLIVHGEFLCIFHFDDTGLNCIPGLYSIPLRLASMLS